MFFSTLGSKIAPEFDRNIILSLPDREFLEYCKVEAFIGSGPGGQHRNRNYTAVRLIFKLCEEITSEDATNRSQKQNIALALQKLRIKIACLWRNNAPETVDYTHLNSENILYALEVAKLIDMLADCRLDHKYAALRLNISASKLLKELARIPEVWQSFQQERKKLGLSELKMPR